MLMKTNFNVSVSLWTLTVKEVRRFLRIWVQTLVPPAVTMSLYFVIFGSLIGPRIGSMDGFDYIQYMIPGLIMLSVITNSYNNVVSSFYYVKFQKSIEELLISPMPNWTILLGFVLGGVCRGVLIGIIVFGVSLLFLLFGGVATERQTNQNNQDSALTFFWLPTLLWVAYF